MARKNTVVKGITITAMERMRNSTNGNPRFRIAFDNGLIAVSQSDASFCYGIENKEYRDVPCDVELTPAGKIAMVTPSSEKRYEK